MAIYIAAALQDKVASLILCSTTDKQPAAGKKYLTTRITSMKASASEEASSASEADIRAAIPMLYAKENQQKALIDEIVAFETANKYPQSAMSFIRQAQACIDFDASEIVNKIISPALVVTGEEDPYYTPAVAEALAKKLPAGTKVAIIPSAAHMIQIEQPQAVGEKIVEFTQGLKLKPTTSPGSKK